MDRHPVPASANPRGSARESRRFPHIEVEKLSRSRVEGRGSRVDLKGEPIMEETRIMAEPGTSVAVVKYTFHASPEQVFKVYTDPELIPMWGGPKEYESTVKEWEARPGGSWRVSQRAPNGEEYEFRGVYHDVKPDRIVQTFEFQGMPGHVMLETVTFEGRDGETEVTDVTAFQSVEDRDGMLKSGMESEVPKVKQRIDDVLETRM